MVESTEKDILLRDVDRVTFDHLPVIRIAISVVWTRKYVVI
jgi:hypothetical protein